MDPGESAAETCARETLEETGLVVLVGRLVGVYSTPNFIFEYADGSQVQAVAMCFEAKVIGGELSKSDETTEFGYFSLAEMKKLDLMVNQMERILDAFAGKAAAFIR